MAILQFDTAGEKKFKAGVSQMVLFPGEAKKAVVGVPWNGITNVTDSPEGGEANEQYADDIKYASLRGAENYKGKIEAFYYPPEFEQCMGNKKVTNGVEAYFNLQDKETFSFAYLTKIGNDTKGMSYGSELNLIWNATVDPVEISHDTLSDSPEPAKFSWNFDAVPLGVAAEGFKPTCKFSITNTTESAAKYKKIYDALYGTASTESGLLMPDDIVTILTEE